MFCSSMHFMISPTKGNDRILSRRNVLSLKHHCHRSKIVPTETTNKSQLATIITYPNTSSFSRYSSWVSSASFSVTPQQHGSASPFFVSFSSCLSSFPAYDGDLGRSSLECLFIANNIEIPMSCLLYVRQVSNTDYSQQPRADYNPLKPARRNAPPGKTRPHRQSCPAHYMHWFPT